MGAGRFILCFILLKLCAEAQPVKEMDKTTSCIKMTADRAEEIKNISEEVKTFINALADKYEDIDFLAFELNIENHSDEENEEKETLLKILVNDCKHNPLSRDGKYIDSDEHSNNDNERELKSTTEVNNNSNDENVSHFDKTSENELSTHESREEPVEDIKLECDGSTEEPTNGTEKENAITEDPEFKNKEEPQNERNDSIVKQNDTDIKENGNNDPKLTINYNFNGNYDNTNLYISPPKADSQLEIGKTFEHFYNELYKLAFMIKCKSPNTNRNAYYGSPLQNFYEQPRGFDYLNHEPNGYYDNPNEIDDLWNILMDKLKRDDKNPKNCVYALKKICGDFGENKNN